MPLCSVGTTVPYVHIIAHKLVMLDTCLFECQRFVTVFLSESCCFSNHVSLVCNQAVAFCLKPLVLLFP